MSRPIVTGAQGFIGKHLIRDLDSAVRCDTVPGFGINKLSFINRS